MDAKAGSTAVDPSYFRVASDGIKRVVENIRKVITIDVRKLEYILAAKIAGGHVMLADSHGVGKTSLARALAGSIQWPKSETTSEGVSIDYFSRIQCTVDLLPQDILGFNRFDLNSNQYLFNRGPLFAHFVLCDEINLLTPKTQGSFFQAMEEQVVSIEGRTYHLPDPFFIISTMNLRGQHLFPLPAPQLDRFMVQLSMGYPPEEEEINIVKKHGQEDSWTGFAAVADVNELMAWQKLVDSVTINNDVIRYIVQLVRKTRGYPGIITGCSPRSGIKLARIVRALALVRGMNYATIDLVKEIAPATLCHRLELEDPALSPQDALARILKEVRA
ncbi:MAG: MoxR family ATPase [Leptospirales bacterium]|nr:MoxR family ATPase [Leptospirales bacterium]